MSKVEPMSKVELMSRVGLMSNLALVALSLVTWCACAVAQEQEFARAAPSYAWSFPRDHGRHDGFQTEWWYYTGQLFKPGQEPFRDPPAYGFQLTFFRRGLKSSAGSAERSHGYLAHAVLTDVAANTCTISTRRAGGELGIAGAASETLRTWSGDWSAELIGSTHVLRFDVAQKESAMVRLLATPAGPPLLQGAGGFSKKGACEQCASMYYSLPGLKLTGSIATPAPVPVHGLGWMDHEFMTNSLAKGQVGWDWMGLMFRNGRRLTLFRLRRADGGVDFSSGSLSQGDGAATVSLTADDFTLTPGQTWRSSASKGEYPVEWTITIPKHGISATVRARVPSCELVDGDGPTYWEGPGGSSDEGVLGYLEMTGYAGDVTL